MSSDLPPRIVAAVLHYLARHAAFFDVLMFFGPHEWQRLTENLVTLVDRTMRRSDGDLAAMHRPPTHPGEVFEEDWRKPSGISQAEAARRMGMSANRLNEIVAGKRGVTAETAVLFGELTGTNPRMWLHLQADHDLWHELQERTSTEGTARVIARTTISDPDRTIQVQQLTVSRAHTAAITQALEEGRASHEPAVVSASERCLLCGVRLTMPYWIARGLCGSCSERTDALGRKADGAEP